MEVKSNEKIINIEIAVFMIIRNSYREAIR